MNVLVVVLEGLALYVALKVNRVHLLNAWHPVGAFKGKYRHRSVIFHAKRQYDKAHVARAEGMSVVVLAGW